MRSPEEIAKDAKIWIKYGVISPVIFIIFAFVTYHFNLLDIDILVLLAGGVAVLTCFVWWFWALGVIIDLSAMSGKAGNALTDIKSLVIMLNKDVREQRDLYDILKKEMSEKSKKKSK